VKNQSRCSLELEADLYLQVAHILRAGCGAETVVPRRQPGRVQAPSAMYWLLVSVMLVGLLKVADVLRALITTAFER